MTAALFVPCYVDQFYPHVAIAALTVLERLGVRVDVPSGAACCGQPSANAGYAREGHSTLARLTDREREVLGHMAQGQNNAAIAKSLFLTERAVEKHINSLFHKLGLTEEPDVHRRVMAVLAFLRDQS